MKLTSKFSIFILCLALCESALSDDIRIFNGLSSYSEAPYSWEILIEIEHKKDFEVKRANSCVDRNELINEFPIDSAPGSYWGWLKKSMRIESKYLSLIGKVKEIEIYEAIYNFKEESSFLKILAFKPEGNSKICPFLVISECCNQMNYASSIVEGESVVTKMQDNITGHNGSPVIVEYPFNLGSGLPIMVRK